MTGQSAVGILDSSLLFVKASEFDGTEVDVPQAVADFLEPDVVLSEEMAGRDAAAVPTDPAVAADEADLEVPGVVQRWECFRERPA